LQPSVPDLILPIFPEGALAGSVVTTVWVGIAVVVFFNLRLGWVLSGLVVPGYLVPLLIAKPAAAAVVVAESIVTYGMVWFYSEFLSQRIGWSNFFGRDRFFALVLCSVLVRIVGDGFALPALGEWLNNEFHLLLDYRNNLHSFGLIIVALIANNFWKTGLRRGLIPLVVTVGVTFLIVRYGLMNFTNFNISSLSYVYEDIAASILASPKAYIILIATAFLASRMNLLYGWDFAGILVPSLLALQWYQPGKILASFVEATVILLLASLVLRLPVFRGVTMEGGRKLLLFFNVSYAYKFVLAYLVLWLWPEQKITDLYGFGYLLPTLIALKMHDKGIYARMSRATLQTSLTAALGATVVGFLLSFVPDPAVFTARADATAPAQAASRGDHLVDVVREARLTDYRTRLQASVPVANGFELDRLREALERLDTHRRNADPGALDQALILLDAAGFLAERVEGRYLVIRDRDATRHWGLYAVNLEPVSELTVEVPAPLDERGTAESGTWLFRLTGAQALAIAGSTRNANRDGSTDVLHAPGTAYQVFHQVFGRREVLQVRGYTSESARLAHGWRGEPDAGKGAAPGSTLWVKHSLPDGLPLARLRELTGSLELRWGELPLPNLQRDTMPEGFAELQLHRDDMRRILARALLTERAVTETRSDLTIDGYLQDWLLADPRRIAAAGSDLYAKPTLEELLFFGDEVVAPLLQAADTGYRDGHWTDTGLDELRLLQNAAGVLGYELLRYHHRGSGSDYLILAESPPAARYWGTFVFRLGEHAPVVLQAPRPIHERNSFEMAVSLFESMHAGALLVGGANPAANRDGSADIVRQANKENIFNVVSQALLRHAGDAPLLVAQSRAAGARPDGALPTADVLLANAGGALAPEQLDPLERQVVDALEAYGLSVALAGGERPGAGYEVGTMPQVAYLGATRNKSFVSFWASPLARATFGQQTEITPQSQQAHALGLPTVETDLATYLAGHGNRLGLLPQSVRDGLAPYFDSQDIVVLHAMIGQHAALRFERVVDPGSRLAFLAVKDTRGRLLALVNLLAREPGTEVRPDADDPREALAAFATGRAAWLIARAAP
jgi:hypothetical protein